MLKYYVSFIVLNILDLVMTYFLINPDLEYNAIGRYLWQNYGFGSIVIMKVLLTAFPIIVFDRYSKIRPREAKLLIVLANAIVVVPVMMLFYLWSTL